MHLTVAADGKRTLLTAKEGQTLLAVLQEAGYAVSAPCGGNGTCGHCRVIYNGKSVLACQTEACDGDVVELSEHGGGVIVTAGNTEFAAGEKTGVGAAVDIGTTTVAVRLLDLAAGTVLAETGAWNRQASFGGDVISRVDHTMKEKEGLSRLSEVIRTQTEDMLCALCAQCGVDRGSVREISLAGNTIMEHLFAGISAESIAQAPFTPQTRFEEYTDDLNGTPVFYAPCVAGYVGGDIVAGLLAANLSEREGKSLFLDIGTNGEMALGGKDGITSCAVASGPAFEGAGITCGMASTEGAVSRVEWGETKFILTVIGGGEAKGFCGSGLIELLAALLELGAVDETGWLMPPDEAPDAVLPYLEEDEQGNGLLRFSETLYFTAKDVRQLQLAKAAVAAGIEVLLDHAGITADDVDALYLAGGFGMHLSPEAAVAIGMFPEELLQKVVPLGNTALAGAGAMLLSSEMRRKGLELMKTCGYLELSGNAAFNDAFMEQMMFGDI